MNFFKIKNSLILIIKYHLGLIDVTFILPLSFRCFLDVIKRSKILSTNSIRSVMTIRSPSLSGKKLEAQVSTNLNLSNN